LGLTYQFSTHRNDALALSYMQRHLHVLQAHYGGENRRVGEALATVGTFKCNQGERALTGSGVHASCSAHRTSYARAVEPGKRPGSAEYRGSTHGRAAVGRYCGILREGPCSIHLYVQRGFNSCMRSSTELPAQGEAGVGERRYSCRC
jgi:hypothetical protein